MVPSCLVSPLTSPVILLWSFLDMPSSVCLFLVHGCSKVLAFSWPSLLFWKAFSAWVKCPEIRTFAYAVPSLWDAPSLPPFWHDQLFL